MVARIFNMVMAKLVEVPSLEAAKALPPTDWVKADCQEHSLTARGFTCGKPAAHLMYCNRDNRAYTMCAPCADHNTKRGMVAVQTKG